MARNRCPHCARRLPYAGRRCIHCGWSVREVLLPAESLISLIVDPGGVPRMPSGDTRLSAGDALVVVSRKESLDILKEQLIGSTHGLDT